MQWDINPTQKYRFSINTNAILIDRYVDYFNNLNSNLEFHINVSSLDSKTHQIISGTKLYNKLMSNLELLTDKNFKVCLNTIFLKGVNDHEVYDFIDYCEDRNFVLRLLQYLPNSANVFLHSPLTFLIVAWTLQHSPIGLIMALDLVTWS